MKVSQETKSPKKLRICGHCRDAYLRPSRRRLWDWPLALLLITPVRCERCRRRRHQWGK
jgi:hypothetical protein